MTDFPGDPRPTKVNAFAPCVDCGKLVTVGRVVTGRMPGATWQDDEFPASIAGQPVRCSDCSRRAKANG